MLQASIYRGGRASRTLWTCFTGTTHSKSREITSGRGSCRSGCPRRTIRSERGAGELDIYSQSPCYGRVGLEGAIAQALAQMDRLYALLSERVIPISVGIYPWPQQLLYDNENSRQVTMWRDWCENKYRRFFNHFPPLFAYKRDHPNFLRDLFIWGDVHYNSFGNALIRARPHRAVSLTTSSSHSCVTITPITCPGANMSRRSAISNCPWCCRKPRSISSRETTFGRPTPRRSFGLPRAA
jgi:hypothetical protein